MSEFNIYIVSKSIIFRKGISSIIEKYLKYDRQAYEVESFEEIDYSKREVIVLCDTNQENFEIFAEEFKKNKDRAKFLAVNLKREQEILYKVVELEMDGYVSDADAYQEILFAIYKIHLGGKYYPGEMILELKNNRLAIKTDILTPREKEILLEMGMGSNNKAIAAKFVITEHTVKKHIRSIFSKMKFEDRTQAVLYVNNHLRK